MSPFERLLHLLTRDEVKAAVDEVADAVTRETAAALYGAEPTVPIALSTAPRAGLTPPTDEQITVALNHYRANVGPTTRLDIVQAADPHRSYHTLAELNALDAAGIEHR